MRQYHIYFPVAHSKNLLDMLLRLGAWLLIDKPRQPVLAAPKLIDTIGSPDRDGEESFYVIDLSAHNEKNVRKAFFTMTSAPKRFPS